jgi:pilus assembly protein Flp/PilA
MLKTKVLAFLADENGATAIEYALIGVFVSICMVVALTKIGTAVQGDFNKVNSGFN